jgi:xylulokinase
MATEVTVGIDIGTTSVKAVMADGDGTVLARARVGHALHASHAGELAHDAGEAWHRGVRTALAEVLAGTGDVAVRGVNVAAMVPSLCAVGADGVPVSPGLLYGDGRGGGGDASKNPSESGELVRFLAWLAREHPDAAGYWPAQAVANHALCGEGVIETTVAMTAWPLFDHTGWDPDAARAAGLHDVASLPRIVVGSEAVGRVPAAGGAVLGGGTIDALGEQLVAGADHDGDVLVILGATCIVWSVVSAWQEVPGLWTVPHTAPGKVLIGGPSNSGGLFQDWAGRLVGPVAPGAVPADPGRVPVWLPYLRGERVPHHDPARRASLHGLDIGLDAVAVRRAAREASGFAARHQFDLAGLAPRRLVVSGGGTRDRAWLQAIADATGLPVDTVGVPEGGALGAAYLARVAAGLEADGQDAGRWASPGIRVEPDPVWAAACDERYARYRELAG